MHIDVILFNIYRIKLNFLFNIEYLLLKNKYRMHVSDMFLKKRSFFSFYKTPTKTVVKVRF